MYMYKAEGVRNLPCGFKFYRCNIPEFLGLGSNVNRDHEGCARVQGGGCRFHALALECLF